MNPDHADAGNDLAIIGMSGAFTGAADLEAFWQHLLSGTDCLDRSSQQTPQAEAGQVLVGSALHHADWFDSNFFDVPAREASWMDPQQRVFLEHAWQALEHAGHDAQQYPGAIGVFAGASGSTYFLALADLYRHATESDRLQMMFGNSPSYLATRVSYKLGLTGPSYTISTACSSSLVAVHTACQSLLAYECDMALAGGVAIQTPRRSSYRYEPGGIVSPDGYCRVFDAAAKGTVFGDGVGVVVLKRLVDALADGDRIFSLIKGTAVNNDGGDKAGYAAPSARGQRAVIAEALANAAVPADTIGYVEAHGTGTTLGDAIELRALREALEAAGARGVGSCAIGSVKANIGHADAASGIAGLFKTVLCLERRTLVPQIHYESPSPELGLESSPLYVNRTRRAWPSHGHRRRAGVSSFGVGGTNVHVVLEEPPHRQPADCGRQFHVWPISAKTPSALRARIEDVRRFVAENDAVAAADVAYTLQTGRRGFDWRAAILCHDTPDAAHRLSVLLLDPEPAVTERDGGAVEAPASTASHPILQFDFPAVDEAWPDYSRLFSSEPAFRSHLSELLPSLFRVAPVDEPEMALARLLRGQAASSQNPALSEDVRRLLLPLALARTFIGWGVEPNRATGTGVGALVARCLNGELDVERALRRLPVQGSRKIVHEPRLPGLVTVEIGPAARVIREARQRSDIRPTVRHDDEHVDPAAALLHAIAELWLIGVKIDWLAHQPDAQRRRLSLPGYPFQRRLVSLQMPNDEPGSVPVSAQSSRAERPLLSTPYRAPRTHAEQALAAIWGEFLGLKSVGMDDDFFELGGDSVLAAGIFARIHRLHAVELPTEALLEVPTLAGLAHHLELRQHTLAAGAVEVEPAHAPEAARSVLLDALDRVEDADISLFPAKAPSGAP